MSVQLENSYELLTKQDSNLFWTKLSNVPYPFVKECLLRQHTYTLDGIEKKYTLESLGMRITEYGVIEEDHSVYVGIVFDKQLEPYIGEASDYIVNEFMKSLLPNNSPCINYVLPIR